MIRSFEFKKFKPNGDLARHAHETLLHLVDFIPTGAVVSAYISKLREKYQCFIKVSAPCGQFAGDILCDDPSDAIDQVSEKLKKEIFNWQVRHMSMNEPSFWNFKEVKI